MKRSLPVLLFAAVAACELIYLPGGQRLATVDLVDCTVTPAQLPPHVVTVTDVGTDYRVVSNGIPDHDVGPFPNPGNPNRISVQSYDYFIPVTPSGSGRALGMHPFGVGLNGVPLDPGAAEFWNDDRNSGWQYEALSGGRNLGLDCNHAHVQPTGAYHYHGMPEGLVANEDTGSGMVQVAWAADGHPIYARYAYEDALDPTSPLRGMLSSWIVKTGTRPDGPGGEYDGTFVEDFEYVPGAGDLDECNGRTGWTPDHGVTYYYMITDMFPFIPRCYRHAPDDSFLRGGP